MPGERLQHEQLLSVLPTMEFCFFSNKPTLGDRGYYIHGLH